MINGLKFKTRKRRRSTHDVTESISTLSRRRNSTKMSSRQTCRDVTVNFEVGLKIAISYESGFRIDIRAHSTVIFETEYVTR